MLDDDEYEVDTKVRVHEDGHVIFTAPWGRFIGQIQDPGSERWVSWNDPEPDISAQDMIEAYIRKEKPDA